MRGGEYGEPDPKNHTGRLEWEIDEAAHERK